MNDEVPNQHETPEPGPWRNPRSSARLVYLPTLIAFVAVLLIGGGLFWWLRAHPNTASSVGNLPKLTTVASVRPPTTNPSALQVPVTISAPSGIVTTPMRVQNQPTPKATLRQPATTRITKLARHTNRAPASPPMPVAGYLSSLTVSATVGTASAIAAAGPGWAYASAW